MAAAHAVLRAGSAAGAAERSCGGRLGVLGWPSGLAGPPVSASASGCLPAELPVGQMGRVKGQPR